MSTDSPKIMVITGASGLIGTHHLIPLARSKGWEVRALTTGSSGRRGDVMFTHWDPPRAAAGDPSAVKAVTEVIDGADAIVNLAGAGVADKRLTPERKKVILNSRVDCAQALIEAWKGCQQPPSFWFQASAVGYYSDTGDTVVREDHKPGNDFLSDVCVQWEAAAQKLYEQVPGAEEKTRIATGRIGIVLSKHGEAWKKMVTPIKFGVGGPLGDGQQYFPWVDADDIARMILFLEHHPQAKGPFNLTAPDPLRQGDFTSVIARRLKRPSFMPAPKFALRLALGELADYILVSTRAVPARLQELGYEFLRPDLNSALSHLLR